MDKIGSKYYRLLAVVLFTLMLTSCNKEEEMKLPVGNVLNDIELIGEWYLIDTLEGKEYVDYLTFDFLSSGESEVFLGGELYYRMPFGWKSSSDSIYIFVEPYFKEFTYLVSQDTLFLTLENTTSIYISKK